MNNGIYADYIRERVLEISNYVLITKSDIRSTSKKFHMSKSTVHKDLSERLEKIDPLLYAETQEILKVNKYQGQLKGGEATKRRWHEMQGRWS